MTSFYKLSGAGNDFIALAGDENLSEPTPESIRSWCRRGLSLGADGVIVLERRGPGRALMRHWNADGGRSDLCLNGSRCAARLAGELGWHDQGQVELDTDAGLLDCRLGKDETVSIVLPAELTKDLMERKEVRLETASGVTRGYFLKVGVPHLVVPLSGDAKAVADLEIASLGPPLRAHPDLGPEGANVNFVSYLSRNRFVLRTWERGVEGETLACGTGAVASASVGEGLGLLDWPVTASTAGGFELEIGARDSALALTGDARLVARGELLPGSTALFRD